MGYRLSRKAEDDVRDIYVFSAQAFGTDQAERYFDGLFETFDFLSRYPQAARMRTELTWDSRAHPYKSHLIFYRLDGQDIFIQRVRHVSEDWVSSPAVE